MDEVTTNALDAEALPLSDYRAMREGKAVAVVADVPTEKQPAETAPESETGDVHESDSQQEQPKKREKGQEVNKRFSELTGQIKDLQRQLAAKSGADAQAEKPPEAKPTPATADVEPDPEKYTDYNAYQRDLVRWEIRQERKAEAEQAKKAEAAREQQTRASRWTDQVSAARSTHADFETVALNPNLPITGTMAAAITDSEVGASILYQLGQNPELAAKISKMSEVAAIREIGKIEASIAAAAAPPPEDPDTEETEADVEPVPTPQPKPVSRAPKPLPQLTGRGSVANPARNVDGMTLAEYRAFRESGKLR